MTNKLTCSHTYLLPLNQPKYPNKSTLTIHADGTSQLVQTVVEDDGSVEKTIVTVRAPGFATVEIDVNFDSTAIRHAAGGRIAITKSGEAVRSTTWLPPMGQGGVVKVLYDTRITTKINGSVKTMRPDHSLVTAFDNSIVAFQSGGIADELAKFKAENKL